MERALVHSSLTEGVASAILQFESEVARATGPAGNTAKALPSAAATGTAPPWTPESFFSETSDSFESRRSRAPAPDEGGYARRDPPELFGDLLAARSRGRSGVTIGAAVLAVVIFVGVPTSRWLLEPQLPVVPTGTLVIVTNPPGATVSIDGLPGETTPLNRKVAAGSHTVELRGVGPSRAIPVTVSPGGQAFQYIELPGALSQVGQLNVHSDPTGAFVTIDGVARGATPIVADLMPGQHTVVLAGDLGWVTQTVSIESGVMAALAVPATSWSIVAP